MRTEDSISIVRRPAALMAILCGAAFLLAATAFRADAQLLKRIKQKVAESTAKKVMEHQVEAESTVVKATDKATDSALTKSNRGLAATMNRTAAAVDSGLNRSERNLAELFGGKDQGSDPLLKELATGRAVLRDVSFVNASADLAATAESTLKRLAAALANSTGAYLIEGHVDPSGDTNADQRLSQARGAAVKGKLVALGVPDSRLFVMGLGSTRPLPAGAVSSARIEVARMQ